MKHNIPFFCVSVLLIFTLFSCKKEQENTQEKEPSTEVAIDTPAVVKNDFAGKTIDELRILRNEIFARKGYIFNDESLNNYFSSKEWYVPNKNAQIDLSDEEKERIASIKQAEALLKPFELPEGYTKLTETTIAEDIDYDGNIDVIQVAKKESDSTRVLLIYLSTTQKTQKTYIAADVTDMTIPYLSYEYGVVNYGINYPGTGHFVREFKLVYNTDIKNLQLTSYLSGHTIMYGFLKKEYNVLSGNYTVTEEAARIYDTETMITVVNKGKQESKIITPDLIDEAFYDYLDRLGWEFKDEPYEDLSCKEQTVHNLKQEFTYGKLNYLGRDKVYIKQLKDFMESVDVDELLNSPDHTYSKSYYLHRDWNLDYIEKDECEDTIFLTIDTNNNAAIIHINNCAYVIEDGEVVHLSEQSTMFEYKIGDNCTYSFERVTGAG